MEDKFKEQHKQSDFNEAEAKTSTQENSSLPPSANDEDLRKTALYTAIYGAYFGTLIEADKSILTISAGGVGLLVTLMTAFELKSFWHIICYLIALGFFVISIIACIFIFKRNQVILHNILMKKSEKDSLLTFLDYLSITCCIIGIIATISIGVAAGIQKLNKNTEKEPSQRCIQVNTLNGNMVIKTFSNLTTTHGGNKNDR